MVFLRHSKRLIWLLLLLFVLPALACNYPGVARPDAQLTGEEIRATLSAREWPSPATPQPTVSPALPPAQPTAELFPEVPTLTPGPVGDGYSYYVQSGDTLPAVAARFEVNPEEITAPLPLDSTAFLPPGTPLNIPNQSGEPLYPGMLMPDGEIINSPAAVGFDVADFIHRAGGYLSTYSERVEERHLTGAEIVTLVATEASINPRLLLGVLEYRSGWVSGEPITPERARYPIGFKVSNYEGLYKELVLTANHLSIGYYGWRWGSKTEMKFSNGERIRISPTLNAGSVAIQYLFGLFHERPEWEQVLYGPDSFSNLYQEMFGDPWERARPVEPLLHPDVALAELQLPFQPGERWGFTGGPHASWSSGTPAGAIDFSPVTGQAACSVSRAWSTASAGGVIARSENGVVILDLDGDGYEQTGWVLMYMHIAAEDRIPAGTVVAVDDRIGHPSCERGRSTGTHVHIARKYNGEWLPAGGPWPLTMSGWEVVPGERLYQGYLVNGEKTVSANPGGPSSSIIVR